MKNVLVKESTAGNVWKYIFEDEKSIVETVLYKYNSFNERTVICCSVQSGCPVGCTFCGTGKNFVKNLTKDEIVNQIKYVFEENKINTNEVQKLQIMFMSMGEPMLNWDNVEAAIRELNELYPNSQLLLSTIGVNNDETFKKIVSLSKEIEQIGLQFSIHKSTDEQRTELIPFKKKYSLREIRDRGMLWNSATGRPVFLNYCIDGKNNSPEDINNLKNLFSPICFNFTFSVICDSDAVNGNQTYRNLDVIQDTMKSFSDEGYNIRMFDPAGQDDIGAGCGQLWYVQEWLKNNKNK